MITLLLIALWWWLIRTRRAPWDAPFGSLWNDFIGRTVCVISVTLISVGVLKWGGFVLHHVHNWARFWHLLWWVL